MGAIIFLSAWTVFYWQAWVMMAAMFGSYSVAIMYSAGRRAPGPRPPRESAGPQVESRTSRRFAESLVSLGFVALLVVPGLDHRFGWSSIPFWISLAADLLVVAGLLITYGVRQMATRWSGATSGTTAAAHKLRMGSAGPRLTVRHPMHAGTLLYQAGMPVALGSWWGLVVFAVILPLFLVRIRYEEKLLRRAFPDEYAEFARRIEYRLVPHVW
ncbi:methyltransferase family protein [Nocardia brasiliensis]|nr:isoprenylcysteine carboxylmethyltransferase family protein [Nocardia brasiliensis]